MLRMAPDDVTGEATQLLARLSEGEAGAADRLLPLVYDQLRQIAGRLMERQPSDHTLQATALVSEAWLKLVTPEARGGWESQQHFLRVAARAMRSVLVDHARARATEKRGGPNVVKLPLDAVLLEAEDRVGELLAFDETLERLEAVDADLARLVELRFYGGLQIDEAARVLELSQRTAERRWRAARMWLRAELQGDVGD